MKRPDPKLVADALSNATAIALLSAIVAMSAATGVLVAWILLTARLV